jgi:hypothetical protein
MTALCILVAGALRATLPAQEFTVAWTHSVQLTRWEEHYVVDGNGLRLIEAGVQGSGAGMEAGTGAVLAQGWWRWHPQLHLTELTLTSSTATRDYDICQDGRCAPLRSLAGLTAEGAAVTIRPCEAAAH